MNKPRTGASVVWWGLLVGLVGALASLARILLVNPEALSTLVWAEDGLFPLCVTRVGAVTCLLDPFAGYLLFAPRLLAQAVAWFPLEQWALATNVVAAVIAGVVVGFAFAIVARAGAPWPIAALVGLLPVVAPIVGFEAINVTASMYMLLLYVMALALAFPGERPAVWWTAVGLLVTALTIPSAAVLFLAIALQAVLRRAPLRALGIWALALGVGLVGQFAVAFSAPDRRNMSVSWDAVTEWVQGMPNALLTAWPGLSFGDATIFGQFPLTPLTLTGWVLVLGVLALGVVGLVRRRGQNGDLAILLLLGLGIGAIPTLTGYANNRYYVVPVLLWLAALFIWLGLGMASRGRVAPWILVTVIALVWSPMFPASAWRAGDTPKWSDEIARVRAECAKDPGAVVEIHFTPDWPMPQTTLTPPTVNAVSCLSIR